MTEPTNAQKEAARQARNAYLRAWRRKNPDKVKAMHEKYWIKKAEREAAKLGDNKREAKELTVYAYLYPTSETKPGGKETRK